MLMKRLLMMSVVFGAVAALATDYTWNGDASGAWNSPDNWEPSTGVPNGGDTATFDFAVTVTDDIAIDSGTLTIVRNAAVSLTGVVKDGSGAGALAVTGSGALHLYGANTFSGGLTASGTSMGKPNGANGGVYVHNGSALGAGMAYLDTTTGPYLYVDPGLTVTTEISLKSSTTDNTGKIVPTVAGNITFAEKVTATTKLYVEGYAGSKYTFKKAVENTANYVFFNKGEFHFKGLTKFFTLNGSASAAYFEAPEGKDRFTNFYIDYPCHFGRADAFTPSRLNFEKGGAWVCLDGFDQSVTSLEAFGTPQKQIGQPATTDNFGFDSPSDRPAIMTFALNNSTATTNVWWGQFKNGAGLCWNPSAAPCVLIVSNTVQATSGELKVLNGTVVVKSGAGFPSLSKTTVGATGVLDVRDSASSFLCGSLEVAVGGKLKLADGPALSCTGARLGETDVTSGVVSAETYPDYVEGDGKLYVCAGGRNAWTGGASGIWSQPSNWSKQSVPAAGELVSIDGKAKVTLDANAATAALGALVVQDATLLLGGWRTCVQSESVIVGKGGVITTAGSYCDGDATGAADPSCRVWIKCGDLTVAADGQIDVTGKGFKSTAVGWSTGAWTASPSHGGGGAIQRGNSVNGQSFGYDNLYDNPLTPTYPGSGVNGYGGGEVRIEATGTVRVDGGIRANGGDSLEGGKLVPKTAGAGGAVWITCATFVGDGGEVLANGGQGGDSVFPLFYWTYRGYVPTTGDVGRETAAAGGMIRIEYGAGQGAAAPVNVTVSARAGIPLGLTVADQDKYRGQADLGTVTFSDETLLRKLLGKGLSGTLTGVSSFELQGDLDWTSGHVRFPNGADQGATVSVTGNLTLNGTGSRLEIGGGTTRRDRDVFLDIDAGTHLNKLSVGGDFKLLDGSAFDIRAAATNATMAWGGEVSVAGDFLVGAQARVNPWCDVANLGAPHFAVGGDFTVAAGGVVNADRRGGMAGRGGRLWQETFGLDESSEAGYGLGASANTGSSHGGLGGKGWAETVGADDGTASGTPGALVDDEWTAACPGAGGGSGGYAEGGAGGGLVYVEAQGDIVVDGTISANGFMSYYNNPGSAKSKALTALFGSGAGGGVHLFGATVSGTGTISARGGDAISGYVTGTEASEGKTFGYASACGGGGRVVIATGADVASQQAGCKVIRATSKDDPEYAQIVDGVSAVFAGTVDVSGGVNIWSVSGQDGTAPQFAQALGGAGTVRYTRAVPKSGLLLIFR